MAKGKKGRGLNRRSAYRTEKRMFHIYTEGERTEKDYIRLLKQIDRVSESAVLRLKASVPQPLRLVQRAARDLERLDRDEARDQVWCIFDVESSNEPNEPNKCKNLLEARNLARKNGIKVATSNPCFELWLVLHFQDHTKPVSTSDIQKVRHGCDGSTGKEVNAAQYMDVQRMDEAVARAKRLQERHRREQRPFPDDNPSSGMYLFLEAIGYQGEPKA
ncbi:RloB family protein [Candidatus Poriferisocius sp.]|uniref:RloB family protein n=1 Tax=Candidatus Poriferisocius sp. TaxID=3101276 RepID=UPI003B5B5902